MECKIWLDAKAQNQGEKEARAVLIRFYDLLPMREEFKELEKKHFHELTNVFKGIKKKSAVERTDTLLQNNFVSLGAPPSGKEIAHANGVAEEEEEVTEENGGGDEDAEGEDDPEDLPHQSKYNRSQRNDFCHNGSR